MATLISPERVPGSLVFTRRRILAAFRPADLLPPVITDPILDEECPEMATIAEYWSEFDSLLTITATATAITLPDVVVAGLPVGVVVQRAIAMLRFRMLSNSDASDNELNVPGTTLPVRVDGFTDAIILTDGMLFTEGSGHINGTTWMGDEDLSSVVDGDGTYNFQFDDAEALADSLLVRDVQVGLRIEYVV
jgi:hypothetical protein